LKRRAVILLGCTFFVAVLASLAILLYSVGFGDLVNKGLAAVVGGGVLALGWVASFVLREISAATEEGEKSEDLQETLRAELYVYQSLLDDDDTEEAKRQLAKRISDGERSGSRYVPFVPRISAPVIFEALVGDIYLLPKDVTDRVVQFYANLSDVRLMAEDLQTKAFIELPGPRRLTAYCDYLDIRRTTCELAEKAVAALNASLGSSDAMRADCINHFEDFIAERKARLRLELEEFSSRSVAPGGPR